jgi:hypothetical protein
MPTHDKHDKIRSAYNGTYTVTGRTGNTYECQDVATLKCRSFHIDRLKLYVTDPNITDSEVALWDAKEYVVQDIVDHKVGKTKSQHKFKVRWQDYGPDQDSWEPYKHVKHTQVFTDYVNANNMTMFCTRQPPKQTP